MANYHRGYSRGIIEGLLTALRIPYQLVAPQAWQRVMHQGTPQGDTKVRSILAAQRLFPDVSLLRSAGSRKLDDGLADELLLGSNDGRPRNWHPAGTGPPREPGQTERAEERSRKHSHAAH